MSVFKASRLGKSLSRASADARRNKPVSDAGDDEPPSVVTELHNCIAQEADMKEANYFRPSSIGGCKRQAFYHFLNYPQDAQRFDPKFKLILDTGNAIHDMVQGWLGKTQKYYACMEAHVWIPGLNIFGHPDTVMVDRKTLYRWVVEFKSINTAGYNKLTKAKDDHKFQANMYAGLLGLNWYTVVYVNKNNNDLREFKYRFDESLFDDATLWCDEVKGNARNKQLPEFVESECDEQFCRYVAICRKARAVAEQEA